MRHIFAVAVSAACLFAACTPAMAEDETFSADAPVAQANAYDRSIFHSETQFAPRLFNNVVMDTTYGTRRKGYIGDGNHLRIKSWSLTYRPFGDGLRLFMGARKDKRPKLGTALMGFDRGGMSLAARRKVSPGVGVGYDVNVDGGTRFSIDGAFAKQNRDPNINQLVRLASLGSGSRRLAAGGERFGPQVRFTLTKAF